MAKKAPILNKNYNPVGEKLRRALEVKDVNTPKKIEKKSLNKTNTLPVTKQVNIESPEKKQKQEGAKTYELRCRCSKFERDKWNKFALDFTGEPNHFSHIFRSILLLLEHAEINLDELSRKVKELEKPSKRDLLAVSFYEQKLANYIFEAVRRAGKPNWRH